MFTKVKIVLHYRAPLPHPTIAGFVAVARQSSMELARIPLAPGDAGASPSLTLGEVAELLSSADLSRVVNIDIYRADVAYTRQALPLARSCIADRRNNNAPIVLDEPIATSRFRRGKTVPA